MGFFLIGLLVIACLVYGLEHVLLIAILVIGLTALSTMNVYAWLTLFFLIALLAFIYR